LRRRQKVTAVPYRMRHLLDRRIELSTVCHILFKHRIMAPGSSNL
jgi:hypothetical protein